MIKIYCYPKCTTCKKAIKWLEEKGVKFEEKHIVEEKLTAKEIEKLYKKSGLDLKKFFNTSGNMYKELNLKDKLKDMSEKEQFDLLATSGMLIKRPLVVGKDFVITGFKEETYIEKLGL